MASSVLSITAPTYLDFAARMDPDNKIAATVELMGQTNDILQDLTPIEGNLPTGNKTTVRTGYPTVTWRMLNYGVQPSKSVTSQITDTCGMLESYAEVDKSLADLNGNAPAWRLSEDRAFLEAMNQEMAGTLFYGNQQANPEEFTGLMPRYPFYRRAIPDPTRSDYNCINNGGATGARQTSIWLVVWNPATAHGIYPKGSQLGFQRQDLGEQTLTDANNGRYQGYRTHYKWDCGYTQRDWRYVVRICNVDSSTISSSVQQVAESIIKAYYCIPNVAMGRAAWYMNNLVAWNLHLQARTQPNLNLGWEDWLGRKVLTMLGLPIRRTDQLLNTEAVVTQAS